MTLTSEEATVLQLFDPALVEDPIARDFLGRLGAIVFRASNVENAGRALRFLLDPELVPARALPALLGSLGWSPARPYVSSLTEAQARRLAAVALPLWRRRGTRSALVDLAGVIAGRYTLTREWFDLRAHTGTWGGPFLVPGLGTATPGAGPYSYPEHVTDLWIEDPTSSADLELLAGFLGSFRPANERLNLYRARFVDTGRRGPGRYGADFAPAAYAWDEEAGILTSTGRIFVARAWTGDGSESSWTDQVVDVRARSRAGAVWGVALHYTDPDNGYWARISQATGQVQIQRFVGGVGTNLGAGTIAHGAEAWIRWRFTVEKLGSGDLLFRAYFEGVLVVEATDTPPTATLRAGGAVAWGGISGGGVDVSGLLVFPVLPDRVRSGPTP